MNQVANTTLELPLSSHAPRAAQWVLHLLKDIKHGTLDLSLPDGSCGKLGTGEAPFAHLHIYDWGVFSQTLKSGDIGFAEGYINNQWSSPNLTQLLTLFLANRKQIESVIYGGFFGRLFYRIKHLLNRNTKTQAKKNIHMHYDLGNSFYRLWLDPSMTYSSALFNDHARHDLQEAQSAKYQTILDWLAPKPGHQLLEIGCGWGGFAEAATALGAHVTGLTLSSEQLNYATQRLEKTGRSELCDLRLQDYRDCTGQFDGIASIEMFEAVGQSFWPEYFQTVAKQLKPGGRAAIQVITIAESLFDRYRKSSDFIQQYIFPGGMLPSKTEFRQQAEKAGLRAVQQMAFGQDYAKTLKLWRQNFNHQLQDIRALGFDERFIRIWNFYLAYCEAGFLESNTDVVQFYLEKSIQT